MRHLSQYRCCIIYAVKFMQGKEKGGKPFDYIYGALAGILYRRDKKSPTERADRLCEPWLICCGRSGSIRRDNAFRLRFYMRRK